MTIHTIGTISKQLDANYAELLNWLTQYPEDDFNAVKIEEKWTAAQHTDHLIKSTAPLNKALRMPKVNLKNTFGLNTRKEQTFEQQVECYRVMLKNGKAKAVGKFIPELKKDFSKDEIHSQLKNELEGLKEVISSWTETELSSYLLPHPVLGKLTIREMMFFTVYHTAHHCRILKEQY